jgi:hypothetical protein
LAGYCGENIVSATFGVCLEVIAKYGFLAFAF